MGNGNQSNANFARCYFFLDFSKYFSLNFLSTKTGYLYEDFLRQEDYQEILKFAKDFGYVLWHSDIQRRLVVSEEGHEHVKTYIKQKRSVAAASRK
jgi:hypothetical protein